MHGFNDTNGPEVPRPVEVSPEVATRAIRTVARLTNEDPREFARFLDYLGLVPKGMTIKKEYQPHE